MNSKSPMFSIIIPLFNKQKYVEKCIKSVLMQTYQNFEVIVINDCSTDESGRIVDRFLSDHRIKMINNQTNMGVGSTRNVGIDISYGKYLLFLDADDEIINNDLLKEINDYIEKYHSYYIVLTRVSNGILRPNTADVSETLIMISDDFYRVTEKERFVISGRYPFSGSASAVISKELIGKHRFVSERVVYEDYNFLIPIFLFAEAYFYSKPSLLKNQSDNSLASENRKKPVYKISHPLYDYLRTSEYKLLKKDFFWRYFIEYLTTHKRSLYFIFMILIYAPLMVVNMGEEIDLRSKVFKIKKVMFDSGIKT